MCPDPGRTPASRHPGGSHDHPLAAQTKRLGARSATTRPLLVAVPTGSGQGVLACDFFSVETAYLQTLYVLFFIEVGTRRVRVMTSTRNPEAGFVTQQARNLYMAEEPPTGARFLIRDRDSKFTRSFDAVFGSDGARVLLTPVRAPKATPSPSAGYAPFAPRSWTGPSYFLAATWTGSFPDTPRITTPTGPIGASGSLAGGSRRRPSSGLTRTRPQA